MVVVRNQADDIERYIKMDAGIYRLLHLREQTEAVGEDMANERGRFDSLRKPSSKPRTVSAFNLFQTPEHIADKMAAVLMPELNPESVVLEPSAGLGRLYRATRAAGHDGPMILVEESPDCCRELYGLTDGDKSAGIIQQDFLGCYGGRVLGELTRIDAIIMNPPFKMGRDIKHILHALSLLEPGGLLVALCYDGVRQNKKLKPICDTWEVLPAGTFKESGTAAGAVMLTIRKE